MYFASKKAATNSKYLNHLENSKHSLSWETQLFHPLGQIWLKEVCCFHGWVKSPHVVDDQCCCVWLPARAPVLLQDLDQELKQFFTPSAPVFLPSASHQQSFFPFTHILCSFLWYRRQTICATQVTHQEKPNSPSHDKREMETCAMGTHIHPQDWAPNLCWVTFQSPTQDQCPSFKQKVNIRWHYINTDAKQNRSFLK